jgi:hypothetical protein
MVPESRDAVLIYMLPGHLRRVPVRLFGMFQRLPGLLRSGFVILFLVGFRGASMRVGGAIVQLGRSLMVLVMRSVVKASGHLKTPYLP